MGIWSLESRFIKKSKASKELEGKNYLIGWWQSISCWTEFLGRLDALDGHFRDSVSEYDKIWKKSKASKDSQTPAIIFAGHLKPRIAVYQKVQGSIQKSPKRPKNWKKKMISLADGRASAVGVNSLDAWTLWTLILETKFQNMTRYEKSPKRPKIPRLPQLSLLGIWSLKSRFIKKSKALYKKVQSVHRIEGKKWFHWLMAEHQRLDWIPWTLGLFGRSF